MSRVHQLLSSALVMAMFVLGAWFGVRHYGAQQFKAGHAAAVSQRALADANALRQRVQENEAKAARQSQVNEAITKGKDEELAPVRERVVAQRVYVGSAVCGDRSSSAPYTESAASGDNADPPGRLVREDVERDIVALKLAVEQDLATGRACQAFLEKNGLIP